MDASIDGRGAKASDCAAKCTDDASCVCSDFTTRGGGSCRLYGVGFHGECEQADDHEPFDIVTEMNKWDCQVQCEDSDDSANCVCYDFSQVGGTCKLFEEYVAPTTTEAPVVTQAPPQQRSPQEVVQAILAMRTFTAGTVVMAKKPPKSEMIELHRQLFQFAIGPVPVAFLVVIELEPKLTVTRVLSANGHIEITLKAGKTLTMSPVVKFNYKTREVSVEGLEVTATGADGSEDGPLFTGGIEAEASVGVDLTARFVAGLVVTVNGVKVGIDGALGLGLSGKADLTLSHALGQEGEMCVSASVDANAKMEYKVVLPELPIMTPAEFVEKNCKRGVALACSRAPKPSKLSDAFLQCAAQSGVSCSRLDEICADVGDTIEGLTPGLNEKIKKVDEVVNSPQWIVVGSNLNPPRPLQMTIPLVSKEWCKPTFTINAERKAVLEAEEPVMCKECAKPECADTGLFITSHRNHQLEDRDGHVGMHVDTGGWQEWKITVAEEQQNTKCVGWRQTGGCNPNGPRESPYDRPCNHVVEGKASGYCECDGGRRAMQKGCSGGGRTCAEACADSKYLITSHRNQQLEDRDGHVGMHVDTGGWQMWKIVPVGEDVPDQDKGKYFITSHRNKQLEDRNGRVGVHDDFGGWQMWQIQDKDGKPPCLPDMTLNSVLEARGWRTAEELATMSDDDKRNTLISELHQADPTQTVGKLQGMSNNKLVYLAE